MLVFSASCSVVRIGLGGIYSPWDVGPPLLGTAVAAGIAKLFREPGSTSIESTSSIPGESDAASAFDGLVSLLGLSDPTAGEDIHLHAPVVVQAWNSPHDSTVVFPSGQIARLGHDLCWNSISSSPSDPRPIEHAMHMACQAMFLTKGFKLPGVGPAGERTSQGGYVGWDGEAGETRSREAFACSLEVLRLAAVPCGSSVRLKVYESGGICVQCADPATVPRPHDRMTAFRIHSESIGMVCPVHT